MTARRIALDALYVLLGVAIAWAALTLATPAGATEVQSVRLTVGDDVYHGNDGPAASLEVRALAGNDRVWLGRGHDELYGGRGDDRLHNFQAASGGIYGGPGRDVCVVGVQPGGGSNVEVSGCEVVRYRDTQGHGDGTEDGITLRDGVIIVEE